MTAKEQIPERKGRSREKIKLLLSAPLFLEKNKGYMEYIAVA
jgi:hypothetical protein